LILLIKKHGCVLNQKSKEELSIKNGGKAEKNKNKVFFKLNEILMLSLVYYPQATDYQRKE
jgi:hypothetical protein